MSGLGLDALHKGNGTVVPLQHLNTDMKFGKRLLNEAIPGFRASYIDYVTLKKYLKSDDVSEMGMVQRIKAELKKVNYFTLGQLTHIINQLRYFEQRIQEESADENVSKLDEIGENIVRIEKFIFQNLEGFRKILKKYRKRTGLSTVWFETIKEDNYLVKGHATIHGLCVYLSNLHKANIERTSSGEKWDPPSSFSRSTTKYWVKSEDLCNFKIRIMRWLPILEVNQSEKPDIEALEKTASQVHNYISSVYLDNDQFDSYHERISMMEGARLFRVRWYGGRLTDESPFPVNSDAYVFVERKTHHEKWTGEKSVKERLQMPARLLADYLLGELTPQTIVDQLRLDKKLKPKDEEYTLQLAHEVQEEVLRRKLVPKIRTVYHRTAFQLETTNEVRVSLDYPLYMVKERTVNANDREEIRKFWSQLDRPLVCHGAKSYPYGVLELKLVGDGPEWVENLKESGLIISKEKFSKFQNSIATNFMDSVNTLPYWIDQDAVNTELAKEAEEDDRVEAANGIGNPSNGSQDRKEKKDGYTDNSTVVPMASVVDGRLGARRRSTIANGDVKINMTGDGEIGVKKQVEKEKAVSTVVRVPPKKNNLVRSRVEPKTFFANERTFIQWISASFFLVTISVAVLEISDAGRVIGTFFFPIAVLFIIYASYMFRKRLRLIREKSADRYDDPIGPIVLSVCVIIAMIVALSVVWLKNDTLPASIAVPFPDDTDAVHCTSPVVNAVTVALQPPVLIAHSHLRPETIWVGDNAYMRQYNETSGTISGSSVINSLVPAESFVGLAKVNRTIFHANSTLNVEKELFLIRTMKGPRVVFEDGEVDKLTDVDNDVLLPTEVLDRLNDDEVEKLAVDYNRNIVAVVLTTSSNTVKIVNSTVNRVIAAVSLPSHGGILGLHVGEELMVFLQSPIIANKPRVFIWNASNISDMSSTSPQVVRANTKFYEEHIVGGALRTDSLLLARATGRLEQCAGV